MSACPCGHPDSDHYRNFGGLFCTNEACANDFDCTFKEAKE